MSKTLRSWRDFAALEARRLQAATLFTQRLTQAEVARRLRVSRASALRWYRAWRRHGRRGLLAAGRAGRKPRLDARQRQRLTTALLAGATAGGFTTNLWTLERVRVVIWKTCRVRYHPHHVWRVLRALGWTRRRPSGRAQDRDEGAITGWVRAAAARN